ncbi:MAG: 5'-nucleotidase, partial [Candidatus Omnitrophica bacterium]|nr:5'-nucleotidase [Candidatus Omnitrophota bacterium]
LDQPEITGGSFRADSVLPPAVRVRKIVQLMIDHGISGEAAGAEEKKWTLKDLTRILAGNCLMDKLQPDEREDFLKALSLRVIQKKNVVVYSSVVNKHVLSAAQVIDILGLSGSEQYYVHRMPVVDAAGGDIRYIFHMASCDDPDALALTELAREPRAYLGADEAQTFKRREEKYFLSTRQAGKLAERAGQFMVLDKNSARAPNGYYYIYSLYLDSPSLHLYWMVRHEDPAFYKLRVRYYDDDPASPAFLEIKNRNRPVFVQKDRVAVHRRAVERILMTWLPERTDLVDPGNAVDWAALQKFCDLGRHLRAVPKCYIVYRRLAFMPAEKHNRARLTFDRDVMAYPARGCFMGLITRFPEEGHRVWTDDDQKVIMEVKYKMDEKPWFFSHLITGLVRGGAPKYAMGMQVMQSEPDDLQHRGFWRRLPDLNRTRSGHLTPMRKDVLTQLRRLGDWHLLPNVNSWPVLEMIKALRRERKKALADQLEAMLKTDHIRIIPLTGVFKKLYGTWAIDAKGQKWMFLVADIAAVSHPECRPTILHETGAMAGQSEEENQKLEKLAAKYAEKLVIAVESCAACPSKTSKSLSPVAPGMIGQKAAKKYFNIKSLEDAGAVSEFLDVRDQFQAMAKDGWRVVRILAGWLRDAGMVSLVADDEALRQMAWAERDGRVWEWGICLRKIVAARNAGRKPGCPEIGPEEILREAINIAAQEGTLQFSANELMTHIKIHETAHIRLGNSNGEYPAWRAQAERFRCFMMPHSGDSLTEDIFAQIKDCHARSMAEGSRPMRLAALKPMIGFFAYSSFNIRAGVWAKLETHSLACEALRQSLAEASDPILIEGALLALGAWHHQHRQDSADEMCVAQDVGLITSFLSWNDDRVRGAALRALRFMHRPKAVTALMQALVMAKDFWAFLVAQELCQTQDAQVIDAVRAYVNREKDELRKARAQGLLVFCVDSSWVGRHLRDKDACCLARRLGMLDEALDTFLFSTATSSDVEAVRKILSKLGFATMDLYKAYQQDADRRELLDSWFSRMIDFQQCLPIDAPPSERQIVPLIMSPSVPAQIDRLLLFAALRNADQEKVAAKLLPCPFDRRHEEEQICGEFFCRQPERFCRGICERELESVRRVLNNSRISSAVAEVLIPFMLVDRMSVLSETRQEKGEELRLMLFAKWRALGRIVEVRDGQMSVRPEFELLIQREYPGALPLRADLGQESLSVMVNAYVRQDRDRLWKYALFEPLAFEQANARVTAVEATSQWRQLSFGAQSALRVLAYEAAVKGALASGEWEKALDALSVDETFAQGRLPTVGIEIQSLSVPEEEVFVYKKMLEYFGIPSPRRPEFGGTVEAAFAPAYTTLAFLVAVPALIRLGLHKNYRVRSALHISLAGDFGSESRFLALPLMFFSMPEQTGGRGIASQIRCLSKGFVYRNRESQAVAYGADIPGVHTELRVIGLQNEPGSATEVFRQFFLFLPAVQALAAALLAYQRQQSGLAATSEDMALVDIWRRYRDAVGGLFRQNGWGEALEQNWFEHTGDPRDVELFQRLKIVRCFDGLKASDTLRLQVRDIFIQFAREVEGVFGRRTLDVSRTRLGHVTPDRRDVLTQLQQFGDWSLLSRVNSWPVLEMIKALRRERKKALADQLEAMLKTDHIRIIPLTGVFKKLYGTWAIDAKGQKWMFLVADIAAVSHPECRPTVVHETGAMAGQSEEENQKLEKLAAKYAEKLVIAVSSSGILDISDSQAVFEKNRAKPGEYLKYQRRHVNKLYPKGPAFSIIRRLLALNDIFPGRVEIVILSRNDQATGERVLRTLEHYGLNLEDAAFLDGDDPVKYLEAYGVHLFLTGNPDDARRAIRLGYAAGQVLDGEAQDDVIDRVIRLAFDFDGVLACDEAERVYKKKGLKGFHASEKKKAHIPLNPGPLKEFLRIISALQKSDALRCSCDPSAKPVIKTAIVTARSAADRQRVIRSLRAWGIRINMMFTRRGKPKGPVLAVLMPQIFFDDQRSHLDKTTAPIARVHVPNGIANAFGKVSCHPFIVALFLFLHGAGHGLLAIIAIGLIGSYSLRRRYPLASITKSVCSNVGEGCSASRSRRDLRTSDFVFRRNLIKMIPWWVLRGKRIVLAKSVSSVIRILRLLTAQLKIAVSGWPERPASEAVITSCLPARRALTTTSPTHSSQRNDGLFGKVNLFIADYGRRVFDAGDNVFFGNLRKIISQNFIECRAIGQKIKDLIDHNAVAFDTWLAMTYGWICGNAVKGHGYFSNCFDKTLTLMPGAVKVGGGVQVPLAASSAMQTSLLKLYNEYNTRRWQHGVVWKLQGWLIARFLSMLWAGFYEEALIFGNSLSSEDFILRHQLADRPYIRRLRRVLDVFRYLGWLGYPFAAVFHNTNDVLWELNKAVRWILRALPLVLRPAMADPMDVYSPAASAASMACEPALTEEAFGRFVGAYLRHEPRKVSPEPQCFVNEFGLFDISADKSVGMPPQWWISEDRHCPFSVEELDGRRCYRLPLGMGGYGGMIAGLESVVIAEGFTGCDCLLVKFRLKVRSRLMVFHIGAPAQYKMILRRVKALAEGADFTAVGAWLFLGSSLSPDEQKMVTELEGCLGCSVVQSQYRDFFGHYKVLETSFVMNGDYIAVLASIVMAPGRDHVFRKAMLWQGVLTKTARRIREPVFIYPAIQAAMMLGRQQFSVDRFGFAGDLMSDDARLFLVPALSGGYRVVLSRPAFQGWDCFISSAWLLERLSVSGIAGSVVEGKNRLWDHDYVVRLDAPSFMLSLTPGNKSIMTGGSDQEQGLGVYVPEYGLSLGVRASRDYVENINRAGIVMSDAFIPAAAVGIGENDLAIINFVIAPCSGPGGCLQRLLFVLQGYRVKGGNVKEMGMIEVSVPIELLAEVKARLA